MLLTFRCNPDLTGDNRTQRHLEAAAQPPGSAYRDGHRRCARNLVLLEHNPHGTAAPLLLPKGFGQMPWWHQTPESSSCHTSCCTRWCQGCQCRCRPVPRGTAEVFLLPGWKQSQRLAGYSAHLCTPVRDEAAAALCQSCERFVLHSRWAHGSWPGTSEVTPATHIFTCKPSS